MNKENYQVTKDEKELIELIRIYHRCYPEMQKENEILINQALDDLLEKL